MEHIERAGVHSGDSACCIPPFSLDEKIITQIEQQTSILAQALQVKGLMNIQYAVQNGDVYVLEVNPRASRTIPFVSKAIGMPLAKLATKIMLDVSLHAQNVSENRESEYYAVKEAVFPFSKFIGVDTILGPEMKSTGEVMELGKHSAKLIKSQLAAGIRFPTKIPGKLAFISVRDHDKPAVVDLARKLQMLGFELVATKELLNILEEVAFRLKR